MSTDVTVHLDVDDLLETGAHMITRHPDGMRSFSLSGPGANPLVWLTADSPDDLVAAAGVLVDVANDWIAELRGDAVDDAELAVTVDAEASVSAPTVAAFARMLNHSDTAARAAIAQDGAA